MMMIMILRSMIHKNSNSKTTKGLRRQRVMVFTISHDSIKMMEKAADDDTMMMRMILGSKIHKNSQRLAKCEGKE